MEKSPVIRKYYVDEAGDATLFAPKGKVVVGSEGCSRYFILGVLDIADPDALNTEMEVLRAYLLADPYFKKVPSMQLEGHKTALAFHAKDDVPEVRREVFTLLMKYDLRFFAVVRNKLKVVEYVRQRNENDPAYRYNPNELYDYMVRRLFRNLLHKDDGYEIYFSKRGKEDRTAALKQALDKARERFAFQWGIQSAAPITVYPRIPSGCGGLQAVDYFMWSLQRFYERREERYMELLWPAFNLVHDLDDTRKNPYGRYYTQKKPLTLAALENDLPGI
jgi:hypothetical protein